MSKETSKWLNTNTLIGFTEKRGTAWHYRSEDQGDLSNHYPGAIPMGDVSRRLFDWTADKLDLFVEFRGKWRGVPGMIALTASDTGDNLGIHTSGYEAKQYSEWLIETVGEFIGDDGNGVQISSAGLLKGRKVAWVQLEQPETVTTPEGVTFRPFVLTSTSLDGSLAFTINEAVTNTVCDNTMNAALSEGRANGSRFRLKATKNSPARKSEVKGVYATLLAVEDDFSKAVAELCATPVSSKQFGQFIELHVPMPSGEAGKAGITRATNKREALTQLWKADERVAPWTGTAWGVVQAVNTYQHHMNIIRNTTGVVDLSTLRAERNMLRAVKGEWATVDGDTLATLDKVLVAAR